MVIGDRSQGAQAAARCPERLRAVVEGGGFGCTQRRFGSLGLGARGGSTPPPQQSPGMPFAGPPKGAGTGYRQAAVKGLAGVRVPCVCPSRALRGAPQGLGTGYRWGTAGGRLGRGACAACVPVPGPRERCLHRALRVAASPHTRTHRSQWCRLRCGGNPGHPGARVGNPGCSHRTRMPRTASAIGNSSECRQRCTEPGLSARMPSIRPDRASP